MQNTFLKLSPALLALSLQAMADTHKGSFEQVYQSIDSNTLRDYTRIISSDEFEGRLPTTVGEERTVDFLVKEFKKLGLKPGNGDSYLQPVQLLEITADPNVSLQLGSQTLAYKENMVVATKHEKEQVSLKDSELVFVGYGVNAPEYNWNDYQGLDVKGKTVVILVNDPGFEKPDSGKFQGKTMTYYGRWTYKYEEASRQGAAGALIVHEDAPASYGWSVVANSWSGPQYSLASSDGNASRVTVEGWISLQAAQKLFAEAGQDFAAMKAKAQQGPFNQALGLTTSVTVNSKLKRSVSNNVIATLPGSSKADEHIIYTAHWDHLGKDESKEGDQIYNGAHDNATGTASLLAMAKAFASLEKAPERSVTFLAVTAEEQGLIGSAYYAEHPVIPMDKTVANLNMDAMNILGRTKDVAVVGMGKSELEKYLEKAVSRQGRTLTREDRPEAGYYYRSDHFSFAKKGVPALYAKGGSTPWDEATADYRKRTKVIVTGCYHQVCDQFREGWDFGGVEQDARMLFEVGYDIATSNDWPKWNASSEFQRTK
ncbi:M28 family metallopeptidase [Aliiglaciecola sp. CAU 1673]|uniref:M28 family metallopeptidase n=1 Tax=Aliiglaciecola sp. CAU 1673 TaxID=3032595 RepID=UPI0023DBAAF1|nr:M28 family metallopeptidase [Aliiglaciecola sp. CAU 1673]MDF2180255.1 M28 family metallopeptidase [Aliiglaciecola sp. CAU 1673]